MSIARSKRIFLASSFELKDDREQFEIFINRKNKEWHKKGFFLELVIWEDFLDAMSKTRLQDKYNKAIKECDIFIMLFFTKVGKYTQEEFETAFGQFKETGKPLIYTFFRDSNINTGDIDDTIMSMLSFKRRLNELGHFVTVYENIDQLELKFTEQLAKLADTGFIEFDQSEKSIFTELKLPKELTNSLPKTRADEIIGREQDLKDLHDLLFNAKRDIVVNGLDGIGKTTLVQAYVSEYYEDYAHIIWITQSSENIGNDFINAEGLLQNLVIEIAKTDPKQLFSDVIRKFKAIEEKPNLLVIDNGEHSLKQYKDILPSQPNWHLLITSMAGITGFHLKSIDSLNEEQSIKLFEKFYTQHKLTGGDIKELVKSVDYHTLTIEILAKTAQAQRYDAATLQQAIEKDIKANIEVQRESGEVERVATYLTKMFGMSELNEAETWLMKQFACLPAEFHTYTVLNELLINKESTYKDSLAETCNKITQKGWLQYNSVTDSYKMHRIVAGVVKRQHDINRDDVRVLIDTIISKLSIDYVKDNPVDKFIWVPFGKTLLEFFSEDSSEDISTLQNNLAMVLEKLGDYNGARILLEKALASNEKNLGEDHPSTALRYSNMAVILQDLGDNKGARSLLEKAVASDEKNFGKDHPSTAKSYSNLAMVLRELKDFKEAKVLMEQALASNENNFGKDHPLTAISYSNLALILQDLRDFKDARVFFEKALASNERNFGKDHPSTAISYSNLGMVLCDLHDNEGARVLLDKALVSDKKNFGKDHPFTAIRYSNLALALKGLGDLEGAKELLEKALACDEKNFGKNHPFTAISYSNLAVVLCDLKDYEGARVLLEKALASDERNFGKDHLTTATSYLKLALVLKDLDNYEGALELCAKAEAIYRKSLSEGHPNFKTVEGVYESIKEKMEGK